MYIPVLQRHIAIARVLPEYAAKGSTVHLEITVDHEYLSVPATTDRLPLYNPARKTGSTARAGPDLEPNGAVMATANSYDAIVVGGGHNGLTNAAYLAQSGLNVLVLERRGFVGGAAITEELHPGFSFTTFSYALSLLRPEIIQELKLVKHGFMPLLMPTSLLTDGGRRLPAATPRTSSSTTRRSGGTARRTSTATTAGATTSRRSSSWPSRCSTTRRPTSSATTPTDQADVAWMVKQLRGADRKTLHDLIRFLTGSAADLLDDYFESDIIKASIASSWIIGNKVGPMSQGSGLVLLYHLMGEQDGHHGAGASTRAATAASPRCCSARRSRSVPRCGSSRRSTT